MASLGGKGFKKCEDARISERERERERAICAMVKKTDLYIYIYLYLYIPIFGGFPWISH
jgi:hypothetical protein